MSGISASGLGRGGCRSRVKSLPPTPGPEDETYLPMRRVAARFGVTRVTIWNWNNDARMAFPQPLYIGRRRYWKLSELLAFEQAKATARPQ